jgi:hypothetical protein
MNSEKLMKVNQLLHPRPINNVRCIAWPFFDGMEVQLEAERNQGQSLASARGPEQSVHPQWSLVGDHVEHSSPLVHVEFEVEALTFLQPSQLARLDLQKRNINK